MNGKDDRESGVLEVLNVLEVLEVITRTAFPSNTSSTFQNASP